MIARSSEEEKTAKPSHSCRSCRGTGYLTLCNNNLPVTGRPSCMMTTIVQPPEPFSGQKMGHVMQGEQRLGSSLESHATTGPISLNSQELAICEQCSSITTANSTAIVSLTSDISSSNHRREHLPLLQQQRQQQPSLNNSSPSLLPYSLGHLLAPDDTDVALPTPDTTFVHRSSTTTSSPLNTSNST